MLFDHMDASRADIGSSGCESSLGRTMSEARCTGCERVTFERSFVNFERLDAILSI